VNTNQRYNEIAIKQFRKELKSMIDDIRVIDVKCINKAVHEGIRVAKQLTPVGEYSNEVDFTTKDGEHVTFTTNQTKVGGFMKKSWRATPTIKKTSYVEKSLVNGADYSSFVNYGHRIVNKDGATIGFVKGQFMLEKAQAKADKVLREEFRKEVERVNKEHGK
jgi:hypothetical protein